MHLTKTIGGLTFTLKAARLLTLVLVGLLASGTARALTTNLVFAIQPVSTVFGATLSNVVVQLRDSRGTNVSLAGVPVTVALNKVGDLAGVTNVSTDVSGRAVFSNLFVNQIGNAYRLQAASAKFKSVLSGAFNIA